MHPELPRISTSVPEPRANLLLNTATSEFVLTLWHGDVLCFNPHPQIWDGVPSELKYKNNGVGLRQKKKCRGGYTRKKYGPKNGVHMGQGPYGPWAPGPSLLDEHLTKKRTLEKILEMCVFV